MTSSIKETKSDRLFVLSCYLYLLVALMIVIYPLIYIISASVSDPKYVGSGEMWLYPMGITFDGYSRVLQNAEIWGGYSNTILYTAVGTLVNLAVTLPAAYALSRQDLAGRGLVMGLILFTMFFSGGLVPTYLLVKDLHMIDTMWALILPSAATVWNIIVSRTFFQSTIPRELQEASEIDGCSDFRLFISIVLPLSAPIITVMALFYGITHWNSYFSALIYLNDADKFPLQMVLRKILVLQELSAESMGIGVSGDSAAAMEKKAEIASLMKYSVIIVSTLPVVIVYPFLQRFFVQGVMIGSVKG
ncbi:carbohydrate ABC transporter permease [Paenibacillus sp. J5C_2022]|uniref:carbohydrate ABC transporter permease n=1 Tax=Paenibacillus sp. J5C2022 TaxID=2977129 RepID=UPI0021D34EF1|nr:carbohydrate ABC transporter permease [Paenibacillus sp. J5C2022]MCU6713136.1 carbohydrate ABC transporter permease [Paenibacillus sp. J5C2022]